MPTMVLPAPAWQDDHAGAAADIAPGMEDVRRLALIVADVERLIVELHRRTQLHRQVRTLGVAGDVLGGITDGDERLFKHAAMGRFDDEAGRVELFAEVFLQLFLTRQLHQQRRIVADHPQSAILMANQLDATISAHCLGNVGRDVAGDRELGVTMEYVEHVVGTEARGGGIPQRQIADAVSVDMLRAFLKLGEGSERIAGLGIFRVIDFDENRAIRLHNERIAGVEVGRGRLCGKLRGHGHRRVSSTIHRNRYVRRFPN